MKTVPPPSACLYQGLLGRHTGELGPGEDVGEGLHEVRQVIAEELCAEHDILPRETGREDAAQELRLALQTQRGALCGVLLSRVSGIT